jgi:diaminopimelate decarboxylase
MVLLAADYSQIELRLLAHLSRDPAFVAAFNAGGDIHRQTASVIFGVPLDQVTAAAAIIATQPRLRLTTLAMHLGSQLSDTEPFRQGIRHLLELAARHPVSVIDIGGGLGIRYANETPMDPVAFAEAVVPLLAPTGHTVYLEPGRFLVGDAR